MMTRRVKCMLVKHAFRSGLKTLQILRYKQGAWNCTDVSTLGLEPCEGHFWWWFEESCIINTEEKVEVPGKQGRVLFHVLQWRMGRPDCSWSNSRERIKRLGWKNWLECQLFSETQLNTPNSTSSPTRYIPLLLLMLHVKVLCNATVTQTTPSLQMLPFHPTLSFSVLTHICPSPFLGPAAVWSGCSQRLAWGCV